MTTEELNQFVLDFALSIGAVEKTYSLTINPFPAIAYEMKYGAHWDGDRPIRPHLCYLTYEENKTITLPGQIFTTYGMCSRMEGNDGEEGYDEYHLKEFNMREIMFAGTEDFVRAKCEEMKTFVEALPLDDLVLLTIDKSNEPRGDMKWEYSVNGHDVASVNYNDRRICDMYHVELEDGNPARSGCMGIGFERFMIAQG